MYRSDASGGIGVTRIFLATMVLAGAATAALADDTDNAYPKTEADLKAAYAALHWQDGNQGYDLPLSGSHLRLVGKYHILLGADARREAFLDNGDEFPNTEAIVVDDKGDAEVEFSFTHDGHVQDDDWKNIDPTDFLKQMQENQIEANKRRVANGKEPLTIIGWLQHPTYDAATHTASWSFELTAKDQHYVNAKALQLSRDGFSELTWIGSIESYHAANGQPAMLDNMLSSHSYKTGSRYIDFKEGDKVAGYGIAALVAGIIGVKLGKGLIAAAIAFLIIAGKKFGVIAALVAGGAASRFKSLFRRKSK